MGNPVQIAQMIRFALGNLSADNAHHTFEHVCREVSTARIVSNIIPATGPVSAGGDQGRDFETFRTYLAEELPFSIGFLALATSDTVVFACTIQKDGLRAKFEEDVESICSQGTAVDRIYIFATANVPTALRHKVQAWAKQKYDVIVDIIDGTALSRWLAEPDLYWIAVQYLNLLPELAPVEKASNEPALPEWYNELRDYWQQPSHDPANLGDLFDLLEGLRYATHPGPARSDLHGWLKLMTRLAENSPSRETRLRATYEIVAARSQGVADLRPVEHLVRRFIEEIEHSEDPTLLFDASIFIQFCSAAATMGHTNIPLAETAGWVSPLRAHIDELLQRPNGLNARAGLLQAAAHLALHLDYTGMEAQGTATLEEVDQQYKSLRESIDKGVLQAHLEGTESVPLVDLDAAMRHLFDLVELLPQAPAYPIGTFSLIVDVLAPVMRDHPLYRQMCDGLDAAIGRQEGDAAAGDRCRHRAQALEKAGRILDALREYHQAKVKWFHGDTLHGTLRAVSSIADIYCTLGMYLAAKKYILGMVCLAHGSANPSDRIYIPIGLFGASNMDHLAGAWISSAQLTSIAAKAQAAWAPDPFNLERHPYITQSMKYQSYTSVIAHQTRPEFLPAIHEIYRGGICDALTHPSDEFTTAENRSEQYWTDWLSEKAGAPFSDVGPRRVIAFHALGIHWSLHSSNNQDDVLALEDFTSLLQIIIVELASLDPVLIEQQVDIEIRSYQIEQTPERAILTRLNQGQRQWLLLIPATEDCGLMEAAVPKRIFTQAFQVLSDLSLLGQEQFSKLMDQGAQNGLLSNLEIGRPYRELALFAEQPTPPLSTPNCRPLVNTERPNPRKGAPQMRPRTGPGPGYSLEKAHAILAERYELLPRAIRITIPSLLSDPAVRSLFQLLRTEGWKDWHLLSVVQNLTVNHRLMIRHGAITSEKVSQLAEEFYDEAMREEKGNDPRIASDSITRDVMEQRIQLVAVSSLGRWGLRMPQGQDPSTVMQILADRYGFWADDIPHPDPFQWTLQG